jgi:hypothetical protein
VLQVNDNPHTMPDIYRPNHSSTPILLDRIMPLGDSITDGDGGISMDDDSLIAGYRQKLYIALLDAGYNNVDFVGSLSSGYSLPPAFDTNHEGLGRWCAGWVFSSVL